ncbi:MAG: acyl-CoA dehydratase activase [Pseudomonadota bacterium]
MIVAGIDVGSRTTCALLKKDGDILSYGLIDTGADSEATSRRAMDAAMAKVNFSHNDIKRIIATGYGRILVPFADKIISEISCHARGAHWLFPGVRTVLDMGGQDCKAIRVDENGNPSNFSMNDKCAAGTGRFLEVMAETLRVPLEEMGPLSLQAKNHTTINSFCTVFAQAEVRLLMREGIPKEEILASLHRALSVRIFALLNKVGIEKEFVITGGIAKNIGVVRVIEERTGFSALIPDESQIVGALGAALMAAEG